jgi:hypothetical protein
VSRWHPINKTKIEKLLQANILTFQEIAQQFGLTKARIGQIANELGIDGYSRRRARLAAKPEDDGTGDKTKVTCLMCRKDKPISVFYIRLSGVPTSWCRACHREYARRLRRKVTK